MDIIKFAKKVDEKTAKSINMKDAESKLESQGIFNFRVYQRQSDKVGWWIEGQKKRDITVALNTMLEDVIDGTMEDDVYSRFADSPLFSNGKKSLVIESQKQYNSLMFSTIGLENGNGYVGKLRKGLDLNPLTKDWSEEEKEKFILDCQQKK